MSNKASRSSSEELSLSLDSSDDTPFDDKYEEKDSESYSTELRGSSEESNENKLHTEKDKNYNSFRKGSVTFCERSNQIVILRPENYSEVKTKQSNRKIGIYGKARHSPNLLHNPYGPPLYHHSRPMKSTTSDKVKSLTLLKTRTRDKNVITAKTKSSSVLESSYMETNGTSVQSHPVSKINVPIKTHQKDYKKEIYQHGKMTEDVNNHDKKQETNELSSYSSKYMKENILQSPSLPFRMKIDESVDTRWRSRERKSSALRSRENISLNRNVDLKPEDTSKKSFIHSNRSHSTPRKESLNKREAPQSKEIHSNKCSDDVNRYVNS